MKQVNTAVAVAIISSAVMAGNVQAAPIGGLFNTGTDANNVALVGGNGVADPHYRILSSTAAGFDGNQAVTFQCCYAAEDGDSRWISLGASGSPGSTTTVYRTTFDLTGLDPTRQVSPAAGAPTTWAPSCSTVPIPASP